MYPNHAKYDAQGMTWHPLDCHLRWGITNRLDEVCRSWEHTPYMPGQREKGEGVDCVRFVCAVLDEMYGVHHEIPREVQDKSLHDPAGALKVTDLVRDYYPDHVDLPADDRGVEPGDVIITGHAQGGPGHAIIVGAQRNTMWQASRVAVRMGGLGLISQYQQIFTIVRPDKSLWIR